MDGLTSQIDELETQLQKIMVKADDDAINQRPKTNFVSDVRDEWL